MFTRTGDKGETDVMQKRVGKDSPLVQFLGDLDELNSFLGLAISKVPWDDMKKDLETVQIHIFEIGEDVATNSTKKKIPEEYVKFLEERTVAYRKESGPVRLFVLPGGSEVAAVIHVVRAVTRRVERNAVALTKELPEMNRTVIVYLNRLSSLLFAMATVANKRLGVQEKVYDIGKYW